MSNLRKCLVSTNNVDFGRVLAEWDIPLDENITAYEANKWLLWMREAAYAATSQDACCAITLSTFADSRLSRLDASVDVFDAVFDKAEITAMGCLRGVLWLVV